MECQQNHQLVFESVDPQVKEPEDIKDMLSSALIYQHMFDRKTSPWEMCSWDQDELQEFEVDPSQVDRLYAIDHVNDSVWGSEFYLLVRMLYRDRYYFVEMSASCDHTGFDCRGGGYIYLTADANLFYQAIGLSPVRRERLYQSLCKDGYDVDETQATNDPVKTWHNAPTLNYVCYDTIWKNKDKLRYAEVLPASLKKSVDDFIRTKEALEDYAN